MEEKFWGTQDIAKLWGISSKTVCRLAKQGKIKGAKLVGKTWLIPFSATQLSDGRTKEGKEKLKQSTAEFKFPLFGYNNYDSNSKNLNEEEQKLLNAQILLIKGEFKKAFVELKSLSENCELYYIQVGSLYSLSGTSLAIGDFYTLKSSIEKLQVLFKQDIPYKKDMEQLLVDLEMLYKGALSLKEFTLDKKYSYHPSTNNYNFVMTSYREIIKNIGNLQNVDTTLLEIYANNISGTYVEHLLNMHISLIYYAKQNLELSSFYMKKVLDYCYSTGYIYDLCSNYIYLQDLIKKCISPYSSEFKEKIKETIAQMELGAKEIKILSNIEQPFSNLSKEEFELIYYSVLGFNSEEISTILKKSYSYVTKKLMNINTQLKVKNKTELKQLFIQKFDNFDIDY